MQLYETISLRSAWWNICCPGCGAPMADNPYRDVRITWSEILGIAVELWGPPNGFFVRDFLITMEFSKGQVILTFCSQGPRRGEVDISVPAGDEEAGKHLKAFMDKVRAIIETAQVSTSQAEYEDDYDDYDEWEEDEEWEE